MSLTFNEIDKLQAFRGNGTTARDKRARNGLERKRRNQVDNGILNFFFLETFNGKAYFL